ncbi:uncharacterized protein [Amphiura filiformis]|uniref:uncharacterized protein n=1 Tax=Amphiura filiformis TaxID=82378 RepID=UPI003B2145A5
MWVSHLSNRYNVVLMLQLLCVLPENSILVRAHACEFGQEREKPNGWRWFLFDKDPCSCTSIGVRGFNVKTTDGEDKIRTFFNLYCNDDDECQTSPCDANAACSNNQGGFDCTCNEGFSGDGLSCTDDDECQTSPCDANAACSNNQGSFDCTCNEGFSGDGLSCTDKYYDDECQTSPCDANAACSNNQGSFNCTCNEGFSGDGLSCTDDDECQTSPCDANAACSNNQGGFDCTCNDGFSGDGLSCTDDDECQTSPCDANAACSNNQGGFDCTCNEGFRGDGLSCTDDGECQTSPCDANAACSNNQGGFECTCNEGFRGDGLSCTDDDECQTSPCDANAACSNNQGGFDCTCNEGFSGDGRSCTVSCSQPLGMENHDSESISDSQLSASSSYEGGYNPREGRLNNNNCWSPSSDEPNEWFQVDFLSEVTITEIITQGCGDVEEEWVTELEIKFGDSESSLFPIRDSANDVITFTANTDPYTAISIPLPAPINARILRIIPKECYTSPEYIWCGLRLEVVDCK